MIAMKMKMVRAKPTMDPPMSFSIDSGGFPLGSAEAKSKAGGAKSDACSQRCAYDEALEWLDLASGTADTPAESEVVDRTTACILEQAGWHEVPPVRAPVSSPLAGVEHRDLDLPTRA
jgi:hypothetical protein